MKIGVPKEIKLFENRVGASPSMVRVFVEAGHQVIIESGAGLGSGMPDHLYLAAGAEIASDATQVWSAEMVLKVKEPEAPEYPFLRENLILMCFLHLSPNAPLTQALVKSKTIAIAFETVTDEQGRLPLLIPMSEIAGRLSIIVGCSALQIISGGKGVLLGAVPGVLPAKVGIIGGGIVGVEAARMAMGLGADVTIVEKNLNRIRELDALFGPRLKTLYSTSQSIEESVCQSDLVIGAVLIPGKLAPKLITQAMVQKMGKGSVIVDVAIDQGGCSETSRVTTHGDPTYNIDGVVHYCVANMPGAYPKTGTEALGNATMEYALILANKGYQLALSEHSGLCEGLNVCRGMVTNEHVALDLGYEYTAPLEAL